jgi:hypothetical protein
MLGDDGDVEAFLVSPGTLIETGAVKLGVRRFAERGHT